jgi:outer membrane protein assembly factor BamB
MMSFKRLWQCVALASVLLLVSCSYLPKASTRPPKFVHQVAFESLWSAGGSQGLGDIQMKLYPNFVMHQGQQWLAIPDYRGVMVVVDPFTGKRIWRSKTKMPFSSAAGEDDNAIVMGCSNGQVVALSKEDGEVLWTSQVSSEVLAAPRGDADALVALSIDSRLHGLDAHTGKSLWTYDATPTALTLRGAADPVIIEDMAFVGFANGQVGLFKLMTGQVLWLEAAAQPRGKNEIDRMVDIDGTIARVDNMVYVVTFHGNLLAIDLPRLEVVWSQPMSSYVGLTVSGNDLIVSDASDNLYALDRMTGQTRWKQDELNGRYISSPAIYEQYVVVGDVHGYLFAFSLSDGQLLGHKHTGDDIRAPILVDSQGVIIQNHTGRVQKFNIVPKDN